MTSDAISVFPVVRRQKKNLAFFVGISASSGWTSAFFAARSGGLWADLCFCIGAADKRWSAPQSGGSEYRTWRTGVGKSAYYP